MTSFLLILYHHPEVEKRLVEEIRNVIGDDRFPTLADRTKMPYMEAAVMELLRYLSHVPFAVPHMTMKDVEIGGYTLPKGTQVYDEELEFIERRIAVLDLFPNKITLVMSS